LLILADSACSSVPLVFLAMGVEVALKSRVYTHVPLREPESVFQLCFKATGALINRFRPCSFLTYSISALFQFGLILFGPILTPPFGLILFGPKEGSLYFLQQKLIYFYFIVLITANMSSHLPVRKKYAVYSKDMLRFSANRH
jgi:hypothetical protein